MNGHKKTIAVTGGTGFLGSHLVRGFVSDGHEVRILSRDPEKSRVWESKVAHVETAEITDAAALERLFDGCDAVVHLVSNFRTSSGDDASYRRINVEGTEAVLSAARKVGVSRLIHCSTIGVHGHVEQTPADENSAFGPGDLYQSTKLEAERFVQQEARRPGMEIVVVRPTSIYGPGDLRMLKMFRMLSKGTFFTLGPCRENFHAVYIDDLIDGYRRCLSTEGIGGETFILGGPDYLPLWDYIQTAARAVGAKDPWIRLPYGPIFGISVLCEKLCVPFGIEPPLHPRRVRFFKNNRAFSIEKARGVLGYDPKIKLDEGMQRTVHWYRENGYL